MTQLESARRGIITDEMKTVARDEQVAVEVLVDKMKTGEIVIPANPNHAGLKPKGIGRLLSTKINANIGTSPSNINLEHELKKLEICIDARADAVMDLSTGGRLDFIREHILERSPLPVGTVPIYHVMVEHNDIGQVDTRDILSTIEKHGRQGVDFITVHCGVTRDILPLIEKRVGGVVSRGGSYLVKWMRTHGRENPLFEHFDDLLDIAREYDMTLSLGDGLRPGSIADASDKAQITELGTLGDLTRRAWQKGVQVIIEGPGHVPLHLIQENMEMQQKICDNAPFYVLGPLVTDVAPGYDHITAAIGGTLAAYYGASFLCYVTPAEHLRLPTLDDVKEGVIASKIAAHAADVAKGRKDALEWDLAMSKKRKNLDWQGMIELAIDPAKARRYRENSDIGKLVEECTMCGEFCAVKVSKESV